MAAIDPETIQPEIVGPLPDDIEQRDHPAALTAPDVPLRQPNNVARLDQRMGLNQEVHEQIIGAVQIGASMREAAGVAGVRYETLQGWLRRGKAYLLALADGQEENWREEPYGALRQAYERALPRGSTRARLEIRTLATDKDVPPAVRLRAAIYIAEAYDRREMLGQNDLDVIDVDDLTSARSISDADRRLAEAITGRKDEIIAAASRVITPRPAVAALADDTDEDDFDPYMPWAPN